MQKSYGNICQRSIIMSYTFNGTKVNISKDQKVWISVYAIHRDPNIYLKPDVYDPERFNDKAVQSRRLTHLSATDQGNALIKWNKFKHHPFLSKNIFDRELWFDFLFVSWKFFLFLGTHFVIYHTKLKILRNYKIETCEKTLIPYVNNPSTFLLTPKDGLYLKINKINRS